MYLALYRKYRPSNFEEVIGQDVIVKTLQNQIKSGKISHAYLFCGSRGTGKTSTAKIFAKAINCLDTKANTPCGKCENCLNSNNIDILEIDAASNNGVDEIRDLREKVKYPPVNGKYKVYIIDEVHMLSVNAFNALLKTLEEPPEFVVFILATTEVHKLPATILSRCMRFDFKLVSVENLVKLLEKICNECGIKYSAQALNLIARAGEGSVRDTLSVADRCIAFCGDNLTAEGVVDVLGVSSKESLSEIVQHLLGGNVGEMLLSLDRVLSSGKSPLVFSRDLIAYLRDLLYVLSVPERAREMVVASDEIYAIMQKQATQRNADTIMSAINTLSDVEAELRYSVQPRVVLECNLVKVISRDDVGLRLSAIEKKMQNCESFGEKVAKNTQILPNEQKFSRDNFGGKAGFCAEVQDNSVSNSNDAVMPNLDEPVAPPKVNIDNNEFASASSQSQIITSNSVDNKLEDKMTETDNLATDPQTQVLADLLSILRKEKALSLVAAISQVKRIGIVGNEIEFVLDDDLTVDMISASKNKKIVENFFEERGLKFSFVSVANAKKGEGVNDLTKLFGGKLQVD